jgi:hypothetical protein
MPSRVRGTFDVKLTRQPPDEVAPGEPVGRMTLDKQFHGDLAASSQGQMLAISSDVKGSAGYVALERVTGTLDGRRGTFALQHSGSMDRGVASLSITVVPDTGTGELAGLTGRMAIEITGGQHFYDFEYELIERPQP